MIVLLIVLAGVGVFALMTYNRLVRLRLLTVNAWSDIEVQLKRRHDLIPSLVETVKGYAGHERKTFESVIEARNRAVQAKGPAALGQAERDLLGSMRQLFALAEAYPDLKASENFAGLQKTLADLEEHIQHARRYYNAAVRDLNTAIQQFPSNLLAGPFGFTQAEFFGLNDPAESAVPKIDFGPQG
jgi:LemA protein